MPLEVGNFWEYDLNLATEGRHDTLRTEIISRSDIETLAPGSDIFISTLFNNGLEVSIDKVLNQNRNDGLYWTGRISETDTLVADEFHFPFPAAPGEISYYRRYAFNSATRTHVLFDSLQITLISENEIVETPAGNLNTRVYLLTIPPPASDIALGTDIFFHYAPGIGLVAQFVRPEGVSDIKSSQLLTDYCLMKEEDTF